ncbi:MAG: Crp/Fnr family transcriptional regulator [Candidatus Competibacterales bacterium]
MFENVPLFDGLGPDALEQIATRFTIRAFPKNAIVINEGDESDSFYVVVAGKVKVFLADEDGREVIITLRGEGFYFGELAYVAQLPRSASVMTMEASRLAVISGGDFMTLLKEYPDIAVNLIRELAHRLQATTVNLRAFALMDVYGRLTKLLRDMAVEGEGGKLIVEEKPTQQTMAKMVGASREMVGRILRELTVGGYISTEGKRLIIHRSLPAGW